MCEKNSHKMALNPKHEVYIKKLATKFCRDEGYDDGDEFLLCEFSEFLFKNGVGLGREILSDFAEEILWEIPTFVHRVCPIEYEEETGHVPQEKPDICFGVECQDKMRMFVEQLFWKEVGLRPIALQDSPKDDVNSVKNVRCLSYPYWVVEWDGVSPKSIFSDEQRNYLLSRNKG